MKTAVKTIVLCAVVVIVSLVTGYTISNQISSKVVEEFKVDLKAKALYNDVNTFCGGREITGGQVATDTLMIKCNPAQ